MPPFAPGSVLLIHERHQSFDLSHRLIMAWVIHVVNGILRICIDLIDLLFWCGELLLNITGLEFAFGDPGADVPQRFKDLIIVGEPKEPQVYYYYAKDKTEVYWVHFTGWKVEQYLDSYELPKKENVFFTGVSPDYPWIYNQIIRELQVQRVNYEDVIKLFMHHIFLTISRYIKEGKQAKNETISDIERAVHYFNENYNKPISIEQYAQEHLMSVNWFIHSFKEVMNVPPMQYIVSLRIAAAKGYLENSDKNINEISNIVGYENALYFSRLFKKHTGMTPSEYKKKNKTRNKEHKGTVLL